MATKNYFKGVIYEAKKVEWPRGKKLWSTVWYVIQFCAIFAIIFFAMDVVINLIMRALGI